MEVIKKHRGTSFVELAIAMSILLVVISISIVRVNRDSLVFDSTVTRVKTDIRRIIVMGQDDYYTYRMSFYRGYYTVSRDGMEIFKRYQGDHTHVLSGTSYLSTYISFI